MFWPCMRLERGVLPRTPPRGSAASLPARGTLFAPRPPCCLGNQGLGNRSRLQRTPGCREQPLPAGEREGQSPSRPVSHFLRTPPYAPSAPDQLGVPAPGLPGAERLFWRSIAGENRASSSIRGAARAEPCPLPNPRKGEFAAVVDPSGCGVDTRLEFVALQEHP